MKLALLLLSLFALSLADYLCPDRPSTGCYSSADVVFHPRSAFSSQPDWSFVKDGLNSDLPYDVPNTNSFYAFCVWDGTNVAQTDFVSPSSSIPNLLSIPAAVNINLDVDGDNIYLHSLIVGLLWASTLTAEQKANTITQVHDLGSDKCWSKSVSFVNSNPPAFPTGSTTLSPANVQPILDRLASRYAFLKGAGPLNPVEFSAAHGAALLFNDLLNTGFTTQAALNDIYSTFHVLGYYGGLWFVRDGFGGVLRPGPSLTLLDSVYSSASGIATAAKATGDITTASGYLNGNTLTPTGTVDPNAFSPPNDIIASFGYNTGYSFQVIEFGAGLAISSGNAGFNAPAGGFTCAGVHPSCTPGSPFPICTAASGSLLGCSFSPQLITANNNYAAALSTFVTSPSTAALADNLLLRQNSSEPIGRRIWLVLSGGITQTPEVFQAIYSVDNAFLETLQSTSLTTFAFANLPTGQAKVDAAALAVASTGASRGWLTSYGYGLSVGGALPRFNLGVTPVV